MSGRHDVELHYYVDAACLHEQHDRCGLTCTWCEAPCLCQCHPVLVGTPQPEGVVDRLARRWGELHQHVGYVDPRGGYEAPTADPTTDATAPGVGDSWRG